MSTAIGIALVAVLGALAAAGFFLTRGGAATDDASKNKRMVQALTLRIGLSVLIFIVILVAWKFGYIKPGGLPIGK